ncbi:MAG: ATP-binding cassette domain-containing protein [Burkholderiales bacterium]|nr:ATP-binding cassette domain-containing protein [Burkholderiales bacterium]
MSESAGILQLQDVDKSFQASHGSVKVLHSVNLSLSKGEFAMLTGPSGSGKSTFLHLAGLLDVPTSGKLFFEDQEVSTLQGSDLCDLRKNSIGIVFQKYYLLPHRSVLENVLFRFRYLDFDHSEAQLKAMQALEMMRLEAISDRPARLLSGGEMQRVAIARAIALMPKLLIADEPTGNLDASSAGSVMGYLRMLNEDGLTILMATHNDSFLQYCSRHLVCSDGCIVECG